MKPILLKIGQVLLIAQLSVFIISSISLGFSVWLLIANIAVVIVFVGYCSWIFKPLKNLEDSSAEMLKTRNEPDSQNLF